MNPPNPVSTESLFIAGCAGALLTMVLQWMLAKNRRVSADHRKDVQNYILYILLTGYAALLVAPPEPAKAFAAGVLMDVVVRTIRRVGAKLQL